MDKLWLAEIPDCFGYGLMVIHPDKATAERRLKAAFRKWARAYDPYPRRTFKQAMDYFGGSVREVELGKVYHDGFRE